MAHTQTINESAPAGTDSASGGAAEFRNLKRDIRQRMEVEHLWADGLTTPTTDGLHIDTAVSKAAGYTLTPEDRVVVCTAALTLALYAVASCPGRAHYVINDHATDDVTIDPSGAETINGAATAVVPAGGIIWLWNNGTKWFAK
jgi:hypothetical protein